MMWVVGLEFGVEYERKDMSPTNFSKLSKWKEKIKGTALRGIGRSGYVLFEVGFL